MKLSRQCENIFTEVYFISNNGGSVQKILFLNDCVCVQCISEIQHRGAIMHVCFLKAVFDDTRLNSKQELLQYKKGYAM